MILNIRSRLSKKGKKIWNDKRTNNELMRKCFYILLLLLSAPIIADAQFSINSGLDDINYSTPKEYEIGGITISGISYFNPATIRSISGLAIGDKIKVPGDRITQAIRKLWDQKLFANVSVSATKIAGDKIFLDIHITELPRLSKFRFKGVKKAKQKDLREEIDLIRGKVVTENLIVNTKNTVTSYFVKKGFLDAEVDIVQENDTNAVNNVILTINIDRGKRIKIKDINFIGNNSLKSGKLSCGQVSSGFGITRDEFGIIDIRISGVTEHFCGQYVHF